MGQQPFHPTRPSPKELTQCAPEPWVGNISGRVESEFFDYALQDRAAADDLDLRIDLFFGVLQHSPGWLWSRLRCQQVLRVHASPDQETARGFVLGPQEHGAQQNRSKNARAQSDNNLLPTKKDIEDDSQRRVHSDTRLCSVTRPLSSELPLVPKRTIRHREEVLPEGETDRADR